MLACRFNLVCGIAITARACVGCITLRYAGRFCYNRLVGVIDHGNFFLSNENLAADGALLTFGKTCFCTGSCLAGDYFLGMLCAKLFFTCITDIVAVLVLVSECCCKLCVTYSTCLCCGTGSCCACGMAESLALSLTALALLRLGAGRIRPGVNVGICDRKLGAAESKYVSTCYCGGKLAVSISGAVELIVLNGFGNSCRATVPYTILQNLKLVCSICFKLKRDVRNCTALFLKSECV